MASDSPAPPIQRKWTANEPTGPGKWTMVAILGFFLVVAVGVFIWSISGRTKPRIFVASLNIAAYNDRDGFADPAYPNWDLESVNALMEKRGLDKWLIAGNAATSQSMDDANAIEQAARATGTWLKRPTGLEPADKNLDTLFFYLRGNCVVYDNQAWFIAGEFSPDTLRKPIAESPISTLPAAIELGKLFDSIADVPARNIIILADICDLVSVPQLGLMVNPVPSKIQEICSTSSLAENKNVWIISASATLQPSHVSQMRERTLLQSASEYALHPKWHESGTNKETLTLDEFYDAVLRYSHRVTDGEQTPLLFRYGQGGHIGSDSGDVWEKGARNVVVAYKTGLEKLAKEAAEAEAKKNLAPEGGGKTSSVNRRIVPGSTVAQSSGQFALSEFFGPTSLSRTRTGFSRNSRQEPQNTENPAKGTAAADPAKAGGENAPATAASPAPISDPFLRFWQLRAELDSRSLNGAGECFAPADFAPKTWMRIQGLVIRNQRMNTIGTDSRAVAEVEAINSGLNHLQTAIASFTQVRNTGDGLAGEMNQAWNQFQQRINNRSAGLSAWASPSRLPSKYFSTWSVSRSRMRGYIDAVSRVPSWIEWCQTNPSEIEAASLLVREIGSFNIPRIASDSILDLQGSDLRTIQRQLDVLNATTHQRFLNAISILPATKPETGLESGKLVTWKQEREIQRLLHSSVPAFADRLALQSRLATLIDQVRKLPEGEQFKFTQEPEENDYHVEIDRTMADLLSSVQNEVGSANIRGDYRRWANLVTSAMKTLATTSVIPPSDESAERLNGWAIELMAAAKQPAPTDIPNSELISWQRDLLAYVSIPDTGQASAMNSGAIIPLSLDRKLYLAASRTEPEKSVVVLNSSVDVEQAHAMPVKRGDGSLPENCFIRWDVGANPPADNAFIEKAIFFTVEGQPAWRGQWTKAGSLPGEEIILRVKAATERSKDFPGVPIVVQIASDAQGAGASQAVSLEIIPPNPDRVDLIVTRLNSDPGMIAEMRAKPVMNSDGTELLDSRGDVIEKIGDLTVPAIKGMAKSRFDFQLSNRASEPRDVRVMVYAADPPVGTQRTSRGQPAVFRAARNASNLVFQSKLIALPGASAVAGPNNDGQAGEKLVRVPLELADAAKVPEGAAPDSNELGAYGLVVVIEDGKSEPVGADPNAPPAFKASGKAWETWISWKANNPYWDRLVEIKPIAADGKMRLQIEVPKSKFTQYGFKTLPVKAFVTDANGADVNGNVNVVPDLNPTDTSFVIEASAPGYRGKVFAHIDIGGYPRAISFSSGMGQPEEADESDRPFAWLDCEKATLATNEPAQNNLQLKRGTTGRGGLVVPNRTGVTANGFGDRISLSTFRIPLRIDLPEPDGMISTSAKLVFRKSDARTGESLEISEDRMLFPRWGSNEGTVEFAAIATDYTYNVTEIASRVGEFEILLDVEGIGQKNEKLVFDTTNPVGSDSTSGTRSIFKISEEDDRLYEDSNLTVEFHTADGETSIEQVFFALVAPGSIEDYSQNEILLDKVRATPNEDKTVWKQQLSGEYLKGQLPGTWRVVARSVDAAGNYQDKNSAATFRWTAKPK